MSNNTMFYIALFLCSFFPLAAMSSPTGTITTIHIDSGQTQNETVEVFVENLPEAITDLSLTLVDPQYTADNILSREVVLEPSDMIRNQEWKVTIDGKTHNKTGDILFFSTFTEKELFNWMPVIRFIPVLTWNDKNGKTQSAVGSPVYLGDSTRAFLYSIILCFFFIACIWIMVALKKGKLIKLFCDKKGHLSLSRSQVGLWTLAVGGFVVGYGLLRIEIPNIPESLVVLMGLSLATGSIGYIQEKAKDADEQTPASTNSPPTPAADGSDNSDTPNSDAKKVTAHFSDLVHEYKNGDKGELSIARAQMVFWTGLTLTLFVFKSILSGEIWEVPWEMVALMGISQVSYLIPKGGKQSS